MRNLYYIVIFIVIILSGCKYDKNPVSTKHGYDLNTKQKAVANELYVKKVQENTTGKENKSGIAYVNKELGFGITFPSSWDGYYKIIDTQGGISINFLGKSLAGTGVTNSTTNGLPIFFILNEKIVTYESLDGVKKIGRVKDLNYYFATGTGVALEPIMLIDNESIKWHKELYGEEVYGESQVSLIHQDWNKAQQMMKDIPAIIKSFYVVEGQGDDSRVLAETE